MRDELKEPKSYYEKRSRILDVKEKKWAIEKQNLERENKIAQEQEELAQEKPKKLTMSKKMLIFLFATCTIIEIFTGFVTIASLKLAFILGIAPDFGPLVALIGAVVGEVIGLAAYFAKAGKENTIGGITYEKAMQDQQLNNIVPQQEDSQEGG